MQSCYQHQLQTLYDPSLIVVVHRQILSLCFGECIQIIGSFHSSKEWSTISIADKESLKKQTIESSEFW